MKKDKDKKHNKIQVTWVGKLFIVISALLLILTIIFGVKYSQYKKAIDQNTYSKSLDYGPGNGDDTFTLLIDVDGDRKADFGYTFSGVYSGATLEKFLKDDIPTKEINFHISTKSLGGYLDGITVRNKSYYQTNKKFWEIDSTTSEHGKNQPNNMTDVGMSLLILGHKNVYQFSYQTLWGN